MRYTPTTFLVPCQSGMEFLGVYTYCTCILHVAYMNFISDNEVCTGKHTFCTVCIFMPFTCRCLGLNERPFTTTEREARVVALLVKTSVIASPPLRRGYTLFLCTYLGLAAPQVSPRLDPWDCRRVHTSYPSGSSKGHNLGYLPPLKGS